jgi:hypothetical protein
MSHWFGRKTSDTEWLPGIPQGVLKNLSDLTKSMQLVPKWFKYSNCRLWETGEDNTGCPRIASVHATSCVFSPQIRLDFIVLLAAAKCWPDLFLEDVIGVSSRPTCAWGIASLRQTTDCVPGYIAEPMLSSLVSQGRELEYFNHFGTNCSWVWSTQSFLAVRVTQWKDNHLSPMRSRVQFRRVQFRPGHTHSLCDRGVTL